MKLKNDYNGLNEQDIMNMTEEQMRIRLLKLVNLKTVNTACYYPTEMFCPDEVADILRGRC